MKKIISISLAILMLTGHLGFAVGTHYCMGIAVESKLMLSHEHMDCGMGEMDGDLEHEGESEAHLSKIPCCEDQYQNIDLEDDYKPVVGQSTLDLDFVAAFVISHIDLFFADQATPQFATYDPPPVTKDIPVLHQVFLI